MASTHSTNVWRIYAFWAMWVSVAFFSVYPICNWLTSRRGEYFSLYFSAELNVPFVPEFMLVYLFMYVLSDRRSFDMVTRWTATVIKDADGKWLILTLHIDTNFLDNPILRVAESAPTTFAVGGARGLRIRIPESSG